MPRKKQQKETPPAALPPIQGQPGRDGPPPSAVQYDLLATLPLPAAPELTGPAAQTVDELFGKDYVSAYAMNRARALSAEIARRKIETVHLYEPLNEQAKFLACKARNRLIRGSNRSGKTLCAAVEVARALLGCDPYGKYPVRDGVCYGVGKDLKHIGEVMYRKLFRAGALQIIRDEVTGQWRAYRPWKDAERKAYCKPAPPLIPPRMVAEIAWENKKEHVPSVVRLVNGWELHFYSSLGHPPKGSAIDLAWFDEEIIDPQWYPEMAARIVDRRGRFIWSFTPEVGTEQAYELHERAEKERIELEEKDRSIMEFESLLADNRHLDEDQKRALAQDLDEEQLRIKVGGEYAITGYRVYPTYNRAVHGYEVCEVPPNWTRYAYVDPGHRVCAVLFCAVPPPGVGRFKLLFDELYLREATAATFAEAMKQKTIGPKFQAFVIDARMALQTEMGIGKTVLQQYQEALAAARVASIATGSGFLFASDDIEAGILAVQGMLRIRADGTTTLRVMGEKLPAFEGEIRRYHRKRVNGKVQNAPDQRKDNHLMDNLRYLALHDPPYVEPPPPPRRESAILKEYRAKLARREKASGGNFVHLGPGSGEGRLW